MNTTRRELLAGAAGVVSLAAWPARSGSLGPPPAPSAEIAAQVGTYGTPQDIVIVYEADGRALAEGRGLKAAPADRLAFERDAQGAVTAVVIGSERLARRDFGAETQAAIQAGVKADPARLRAQALAASPPLEAGPRRPADLVDLTTVDPAIRLDIRYATANNFMGFPLYERAAAYLQRPAAQALGRAAAALKAHGYGLLIHDAYRPWFVTKMFWEATPAEARVFVADPAEGSRHNRGCAVDLTLYDLASGEPLEMTGRYDEMSIRSYPDFVGGTSRQRWLRDLLRREMERQGFTVYPQEWWHFDYRDWPLYGIGTATFTELSNLRR
ncbi:MAG TPA: M15 family metallopeptidase [Phenylobacterium sp.]|nr:M15 family metallopeptidase [Phenylobacterium sp.]